MVRNVFLKVICYKANFFVSEFTISGVDRTCVAMLLSYNEVFSFTGHCSAVYCTDILFSLMYDHLG